MTLNKSTKRSSLRLNAYQLSLLAFEVFNLLFQGSNSLFQSRLLLLRFLQQFLSFCELGLVHGLDVCGLFAPFRLQFLQLVTQTPVLCLQETNLLDVARKPLVQVLYDSTL